MAILPRNQRLFSAWTDRKSENFPFRGGFPHETVNSEDGLRPTTRAKLENARPLLCERPAAALAFCTVPPCSVSILILFRLACKLLTEKLLHRCIRSPIRFEKVTPAVKPIAEPVKTENKDPIPCLFFCA
jgi:hypothetical protein